MRISAKGFTFFEILLVIAIGSAITAIGIIGLSQLQTIFKLRSSGDEVRSMLQLGRELAIANKGQVAYTLALSAAVFSLSGGGIEVARFQPPAGITYQPTTFSWGFTPLTGTLIGCTLPCSLVLTSGGETEAIIVSTNGIIN